MKSGNNDIRRRRSAGCIDFNSHLVSEQDDLLTSGTGVGVGSKIDPSPKTLLLCDGCSIVYENKSDWNNCPRCGDKLREVEKA